jgi:hypothetical protein
VIIPFTQSGDADWVKTTRLRQSSHYYNTSRQRRYRVLTSSRIPKSKMRNNHARFPEAFFSFGGISRQMKK